MPGYTRRGERDNTEPEVEEKRGSTGSKGSVTGECIRYLYGPCVDRIPQTYPTRETNRVR